MKNKVGKLTTHWGERPPTKELGSSRTTPVTFWGGYGTYLL